MKEFVEKGVAFDATANIHNVVGLQVLSKSGKPVGRVRQVRVHNGVVAGVLVQNLPRTPIYVGTSYIKDITQDAVLLNTDLVLYEGRSVITSDGKRVGRVQRVLRKGTSNEITGLSVRRWWRVRTVPISDVKSLGPTIILKKSYATLNS